MNELGTNFDERLTKGQAAEMLLLKAFKEQIYPNTDCGLGPQVTEENWNDTRRAQIMDNKVNGDIWFTDLDGNKCVVDAKSGRWIAKDSIDNFTTENSYYFLNAGTYTESFVYLMIRFDEGMKSFIKALPIVTMINQGKSTDGYTIDFDDIQGDELGKRIMDIDPMQYHKILRDRLIECDKMNPPIQSYITRERN